MYVQYESSITYHSKAMTNVKVFVDKQTDRRTADKGTGQKLYASIYRCGCIKNYDHHNFLYLAPGPLHFMKQGPSFIGSQFV